MTFKTSTKIRKPKLLIFIVAYNAETTIQKVLLRIPAELLKEYQVEALVIDDASKDKTFEHAHALKLDEKLPFVLHVLFNPINQGYGGNQKIGYHFALQNNFDFVVLLHGDGQYAPECLPDLVAPLRRGEAEAVFGSRMMKPNNPLKGGMPLYKFVGNKILSWFENRMLRTNFSEFHSGYRAYSVAALKNIPWQLNTNLFHFDTEIIIQLVFAGLRIKEIPIPTYYGDEICNVNGLKYAWDVTLAALKARTQELGLFYDRRFDCKSADRGNVHYQAKLDYLSPHTLCLERVQKGSRVLDLGCAGGYVSALLREKRDCHVTGVDIYPLAPGIELDAFFQQDLNHSLPKIKFEDYDYILLLDVLEHLTIPEEFVDKLREALKLAPQTQLLVSTANVGFLITRIMHLLGQFNYGKRGVMDMTHTRLFYLSSFRRIFEQAGFQVMEVRGIPGPYPFALGNNWLSRLLLSVNGALIYVSKNLFSYQLFMVVKPLPSLEYLLSVAQRESAHRIISFNNTESTERLTNLPRG
jgi:glycosyltransferase involved in cell wall biosynthesis